ncbi:MAG: phosphatidylserine decarboxylase proenzyme [Porticoccaceae bacterium]|nr:MAG: phosphatidylserine decarboxylase proenzyme [Porticoccaceae bacterium]
MRAALCERLAVGAQRLAPQRALSRLAGALADCRWPPLKNALIRLALHHYGIDLGEAENPDPAAYPTFNAFFTRRLRPGARPVDPDPAALVAPADGTLRDFGTLDGGPVAAKGRGFSLEELLASREEATLFRGGGFATVYLSPRDYHRVHQPLAGELVTACYLPGKLFSVNDATSRHVPGLFGRNERLVLRFATAQGPLAVVLVGALLVAGIETPWHGRWRARQRTLVRQDPPLPVGKGEEIGCFCFGSTAIVLTARPPAWRAELAPGKAVRVGEALGRFSDAKSG